MALSVISPNTSQASVHSEWLRVRASWHCHRHCGVEHIRVPSAVVHPSKTMTMESILFRVPPEIRLAIFTWVLGERRIHLNSFHPQARSLPDGYHESSIALEQPRTFSTVIYICWWHSVCLEDCQVCTGQYNCRSLNRAVPFQARMDLRLLRASKLIHDEASNILFRFNTFMFSEANTMERFIATVGPGQRARIQQMQLDMVLWQDRTWPSALTKHIIPHCVGLIRLSLVIDLGLRQPFRKEDGIGQMHDIIQKLCPGLLSLSVLPLQQVQVTIKGRTTWIQQASHDMETVIRAVLLKIPISSHSGRGEVQDQHLERDSFTNGPRDQARVPLMFDKGLPALPQNPSN